MRLLLWVELGRALQPHTSHHTESDCAQRHSHRFTEKERKKEPQHKMSVVVEKMRGKKKKIASPFQEIRNSTQGSEEVA